MYLWHRVLWSSWISWHHYRKLGGSFKTQIVAYRQNYSRALNNFNEFHSKCILKSTNNGCECVGGWVSDRSVSVFPLCLLALWARHCLHVAIFDLWQREWNMKVCVTASYLSSCDCWPSRISPQPHPTLDSWTHQIPAIITHLLTPHAVILIQLTIMTPSTRIFVLPYSQIWTRFF